MQGERSVGEINRRIALSQSALSQHPAVLREDGLVSTRRDGQTMTRWPLDRSSKCCTCCTGCIVRRTSHVEVWPCPSPNVRPFFHADTSTWSYVVHDPHSPAAAIIDPVLDYDAASARIGSEHLLPMLDHIAQHRLDVQWLLKPMRMPITSVPRTG